MKPISVVTSFAISTMLAFAPAASANGTDLADACRAESTYDLSLGENWLRFDRGPPDSQRIEIGGGRLKLGGDLTTTSLEDRDRLVLFEQVVRGLVPEVRELAKRGVDLALVALRTEARELVGGPLNAQAEARLALRRDELHARIDASQSTLDWQGEAFERYAQGLVSEWVPLLGADVARRAMELAMAGDLAGASALQQRTQRLPDTLRTRIEASLAPLQPDVQRLCPRVRELAALNSGMAVRLDHGGALELVSLRE